LIKKWRSSINARMIVVLIAALAVGVACYFGVDALGTAAIDRWYLSDDAIAARNLEHERSLQEYVSARGVSSRDTLAIEQWSRGEKKANVIVYQAEGDPYEAGSWGTSELLDDTTQSDIADLGYSFFTLQFADGEYRVAVCDYSEAWLYSYVSFVIYSFIAFGFTRRLTRRVTRLSEAVGAAGALNQTIPVVGTDELARLAASVNTMRDTILERTRNEQTAWQANSDLITAMSHDIRNPLTSLIGYLDLLEMQQAQLPEDLRRYVLASRDNAYQLKDLTGEMFRYFLVFSRGEQETHPEPYDAQILCAQLLGECAEELRSRGFDVNLLLLGTPCTVTTDAQMLKRVTDNLLSNIEKYADPAARLTILAEREGERLHVCFANRARRELARVESNHIGLRTCAAILKLLGGEFVTHRDGDAFTAEFTLPVTPPDAAQSET
jgi:signal transduction histidine kinase